MSLGWRDGETAVIKDILDNSENTQVEWIIEDMELNT